MKKFKIDEDIDNNLLEEEIINPILYRNIMTQRIEKRKSIELPLEIKKRIKTLKKIYDNKFGNKFLDVKPDSFITFIEQFKNYFFSSDSDFLLHFPKLRKELLKEKKIDFYELKSKINVGSLLFYSVNDKIKKDNSGKNEKLFSFSKNFATSEPKDVVSSEYYKVKIWDKNLKRVNRILGNSLLGKVFKKNSKEYETVNKLIEEKNKEDQNEIINENKKLFETLSEKNLTNFRPKTFITSTDFLDNYSNSSKKKENNFHMNRNKTEKKLSLFHLSNNQTIEEIDKNKMKTINLITDTKKINKKIIKNSIINKNKLSNKRPAFRSSINIKNNHTPAKIKIPLLNIANIKNKKKGKEISLTDRVYHSPFLTILERKNEESITSKTLKKRTKKFRKTFYSGAKTLRSNVNRCNSKLIKLIDENITSFKRKKNFEKNNEFSIYKVLKDSNNDESENEPKNSLNEIKNIVKKARSNLIGEEENRQKELKFFHKNFFYIRDDIALGMVDKIFDPSQIPKEKAVDILAILNEKKDAKRNKDMVKIRSKVENNYIKMIKLKNAYL